MKKILTIILSLIIISSCYFPNNKEEREEAARLADEKQKDIVIVLVRTNTKDNLFLEGAQLAITELNDLGGVLTDRKIIPLIRDDVGQADVGQKIAREMAYNLDVIAVIGHRYSSVAIPASITYEKNGIVFISNGSTTPTLTAHKSQYIFRNIPSDKIIGKALAKFTKREGFKNIAVFFERGIYGQRLSGFFREEVVKKREYKKNKKDEAVNDENKKDEAVNGENKETDNDNEELKNEKLQIVATRSYFKNEDENKKSDFRPLLEDMQDLKPDAIFLAGSVSTAAEFIKQTRSMGVYAPFIGGDSLENPKLWEECSLDAAGTYVASVFNPDYDKAFVERFKEFVKKLDKSSTYEYEYEKDDYQPDAKAAQGYDAVKLLAWAIENTGSTVPIEIASTLRYMKTTWDGVVGPYQMTSTGDITNRAIHIKKLSDGKFTVEDTIEAKDLYKKDKDSELK